jgi:hypothetical protein
MMQLKSLYHEPNWRFRFTNWNIHYRIAFLHFRLCHFKTAITGATDLDMYWISAAAFALFIGACGKSAQIPLYTWLPDAMAGPTCFSINTCCNNGYCRYLYDHEIKLSI